jgi:hypothetical protein
MRGGDADMRGASECKSCQQNEERSHAS